MLNQKSVLARLLANENIEVTQGNYPTAFFDVQKRQLGLPNWKDMSKDIYDLLVGHEVGHALETPADFVERMKERSVPHGYMNVVEDIRIEKKMLARYPGLVGNFKRGYKELFFDRDLFEVADKDIATLPFMDRLNIKSKGRDLVEVPFAADEVPYFNKAMAVNTFEEVIEVCAEILAWLKDKKEKQGEKEETNKDITIPGMSSPMQNQSGEESDDGDEEVKSPAKPSNEVKEGDEEGQTSGNEQGDEKKDEETSGTPSKGAGGQVTDDELEGVASDEAYERNQSDLVESSNKIFAVGMNRDQFEILRVKYEEIAKGRDERVALYGQSGFPTDAWIKFQADTKPIVNLMVKEFEMRKAAYRSIRARTSTKGSLDVNKLHTYKYNDQLFKQVTTLADGKNHGMVMLVDYSGSMSNVMNSVIRQTLTLIMFCKRVNIPFEVYGFTSVADNKDQVFKKKIADAANGKTMFDVADLNLFELFSSKMSKATFETASKMFFWRSENRSIHSAQESYGNTPLNAALMAMHYVISDFRKTFNVEKMNLVTLTDGASNSPYITYGDDFQRSYGSYPTAAKVQIEKKVVELPIRNYGNSAATAALIRSIAEMGVKTINYFVAGRYEMNGELYRVTRDFETKNKMNRQIKSDGILVLDAESGYDRRFLVLDVTMRDAVEDLEFSDTATAAQIAKAFSKFSGSKKKSRVITQKFAEIVA